MTSAIRVISFPHLHFIFIPSIHGLCKSISLSENFFIDFSFSSLTLPMTSSLPQEHFQTGSGVPQNLNLDNAQSFAPSSHFPNLPSLMCSGSQLISLFSSTILSLTLLTRINQ